jgi:hypothetical protein
LSSIVWLDIRNGAVTIGDKIPPIAVIIHNRDNQTGLEFQHTSKLYQAYLISTGLCITAGIPFIILSFHKRTESHINQESKGEERSNIQLLSDLS